MGRFSTRKCPHKEIRIIYPVEKNSISFSFKPISWIWSICLAQYSWLLNTGHRELSERRNLNLHKIWHGMWFWLFIFLQMNGGHNGRQIFIFSDHPLHARIYNFSSAKYTSRWWRSLLKFLYAKKERFKNLFCFAWAASYNVHILFLQWLHPSAHSFVDYKKIIWDEDQHVAASCLWQRSLRS